MGKLEKILAWQLTKVRNKKEVIDEARKEGKTVQFASLMDICHLKYSEWEPKFQKCKGRVVLRGDIVEDDSGSYAVFTEQGSSASQMTAAKVMDGQGMGFPRHVQNGRLGPARVPKLRVCKHLRYRVAHAQKPPVRRREEEPGLPARVSVCHVVRGRQSSPVVDCAQVAGKAGENGQNSGETGGSSPWARPSAPRCGGDQGWVTGRTPLLF